LNTVKRRWPDLLIGLLVLLLLAGFAALLLGKNGPSRTQAGVVQSSDAGSQSSGNQSSESQGSESQSSGTGTQAQTGSAQVTPPTSAQPSTTPARTTDTPRAGTASSGSSSTGDTSSSAIPTIPAAPVTKPAAPSTATGETTTATETPQPQQGETPTQTTTTPTTAEPAARSGGAVATSETRTPTRNDYRISLGSYTDTAALQATTAGVSKLGYTVYPIAVASGVVAQVGPFASREAAAQALADIQRALPGALLYPPRNAPVRSTTGDSGAATSTATPAPSTSSEPTSAPAATAPARTSTATESAASGPVYLQVGAYNSTTAAQTAVARVRDLGLEPSVNAPSGRLVTVVVGPFEGRALTAAEAKLQAGGIDSFRVR